MSDNAGHKLSKVSAMTIIIILILLIGVLGIIFYLQSNAGTTWRVIFDYGNRQVGVTVKDGDLVTEPTDTTPPAGKRFDGWVQNIAGGGQALYNFSQPVTDNITLYALFGVNQYTATFYSNYPGSTQQQVLGEVLSVFGNIVPLPGITADDESGNYIFNDAYDNTSVLSGVAVDPRFAFLGWASTATPGPDTVIPDSTFNMPASDISFYALWTGTPETVTLDFTKGTMSGAVIGDGGSIAYSGNGINYNTYFTIPQEYTAANITDPAYKSYFEGLTVSDINGYSISNGRLTDAVLSDLGVTYIPGGVGAAVPLTVSTLLAGGDKVLILGSTTFADSAEQCWQAGTGSVLFDMNITGSMPAYSGGFVASDSNKVGYVAGYKCLLPDITDYAHYALIGWNTKADGTGTYYYISGYDSASFYKMTDGSVTLYAVWQADGYTITYNGNGGFGGTDGTQSYITTKAYPYDPDGNINKVAVSDISNIQDVQVSLFGFVKIHYTFVGWNTMADGTGSPFIAGAFITLTANTTLYAQWVPAMISVIFDDFSEPAGALYVGSGSNPLINTQAAYLSNYVIPSFNSADIISADKIKIFDGLKIAGGTEVYQPGDTITINQNDIPLASTDVLHLQFVWAASPYGVSYNLNGGSASISNTPSFVAGQGYDIPGTVPVRANYIFDSWNTQSDFAGASYSAGSSFIMPQADVMLYAHWTGVNVNFKYYNYDGTLINYSGSNAAFGDDCTVTSNFINSMVSVEDFASRPGYNFNGWSTGPNGAGAVYGLGSTINISSYVTLSGINTLNLYAIWAPKQVTVIYNSNTDEDAEFTVTGTYDSAYTFAENTFTNQDYTFVGWSIGGSGDLAVFAVGASENMDYSSFPSLFNNGDGTLSLTLYAIWAGEIQYVSFDANGGSGYIPTQTVAFGGQIDLSQIDSSVVVRTYFTLAGWSLGGTVYGVNDIIANIRLGAPYAATLYAVWAGAPVTATFNSNYGAISTNTSSLTDISFTISSSYGANITLPGDAAAQANGFLYTNYYVSGWNTNADGLGISYDANGSPTLDYSNFDIVDGNVNLYAVWAGEECLVTVKMDDGYLGGVECSNINAQIAYGNYFTFPSVSGLIIDELGTQYFGGYVMPSGFTIYQPGTKYLVIPDDLSTPIIFVINWATSANILSFDINYPAEGTKDPSTQQFASWIYPTGEENALPTPQDTADYVFVGWNTNQLATADDPSNITPQSSGYYLYPMPGGNTTYYAIWALAFKSFVYNGNGADSGTGPVALTGGYYLDKVYLPDAGDFIKENYNFKGWSLSADGAVVYPYGSQFSLTAALTGGKTSIIFYAVWQGDSKDIIIYGNGGMAQDSTNIVTVFAAFNAQFTLTNDLFMRYGYYLSGFNTQADGLGVNIPLGSYTLNGGTINSSDIYQALYSAWLGGGDSPLYAVWAGQPTAVTLDINYGSTVQSLQFANANGTSVNVGDYFYTNGILKSTYAGIDNEFLGISLLKAGGLIDKAALFTFDYANNNATYYAIWGARPVVSVGFDKNGGSGGGPAAMPVELGQSLVLPACTFAAPAGQQFAGWGITSASAVGFAANSSVLVDGINNAGIYTYFIGGSQVGSLVLYAIWQPITLTITYYGGTGASGSMDVGTVLYGYDYLTDGNTGFTYGDPHYYFAGWSLTAGGTVNYAAGQTIAAVKANLSLYAVWAPYSYTITLMSGADVLFSEDLYYGQQYVLSDLVQGKLVRADGYTLQYFTANAGGGTVYNLGFALTVTGSLTLYAQWSGLRTIQFNGGISGGVNATLSGISGGDSTIYIPSKPNVGDTIYPFIWLQAFMVPGADNAVLKGWTVTSADGTSYSYTDNTGISYGFTIPNILGADGLPVYTFIFTANWGTRQAEITYFGNGAGSNTVYTDYTNGSSTFTAQGEIFSRMGYDLLCWTSDPSIIVNQNADGSVPADGITIFKLNGTYNVTGNMNLYACWVPNRVNISFDANGGNGSMAGLQMNIGTEYTLPACLFTNGYYTFAGWATSRTGVPYPVGYQYQITGDVTQITGDVTFYARWTPSPVTIYFDGNYASSGSVGAVFGYVGGDYTTNTYTNPPFILSGYTLYGWSLGQRLPAGTASGAGVSVVPMGGTIAIPDSGTTILTVPESGTITFTGGAVVSGLTPGSLYVVLYAVWI